PPARRPRRRDRPRLGGHPHDGVPRLRGLRRLRGRAGDPRLVGPPPAAGRWPMSARVLSRLLRSPGDIAACCREDRETRAIAVTSLAALAVGAAVFGGVIGSFRGGAQI